MVWVLKERMDLEAKIPHAAERLKKAREKHDAAQAAVDTAEAPASKGAQSRKRLRTQMKNAREGLSQVYQVRKGDLTGACGVIITGHNR